MIHNINVLKGKTLSKIFHKNKDGEDELFFLTTEGEFYKMHHEHE